MSTIIIIVDCLSYHLCYIHTNTPSAISHSGKWKAPFSIIVYTNIPYKNVGFNVNEVYRIAYLSIFLSFVVESGELRGKTFFTIY